MTLKTYNFQLNNQDYKLDCLRYDNNLYFTLDTLTTILKAENQRIKDFYRKQNLFITKHLFYVTDNNITTDSDFVSFENTIKIITDSKRNISKELIDHLIAEKLNILSIFNENDSKTNDSDQKISNSELETKIKIDHFTHIFLTTTVNFFIQNDEIIYFDLKEISQLLGYKNFNYLKKKYQAFIYDYNNLCLIDTFILNKLIYQNKIQTPLAKQFSDYLVSILIPYSKDLLLDIQENKKQVTLYYLTKPLTLRNSKNGLWLNQKELFHILELDDQALVTIPESQLLFCKATNSYFISDLCCYRLIRDSQIQDKEYVSNWLFNTVLFDTKRSAFYTVSLKNYEKLERENCYLLAELNIFRSLISTHSFLTLSNYITKYLIDNKYFFNVKDSIQLMVNLGVINRKTSRSKSYAANSLYKDFFDTRFVYYGKDKEELLTEINMEDYKAGKYKDVTSQLVVKECKAVELTVKINNLYLKKAFNSDTMNHYLSKGKCEIKYKNYDNN